ncbi:MAG: TolC family outer membrane protein [Methylotenera sp.]
MRLFLICFMIALGANTGEASAADDLISLYQQAVNYDAKYRAALANTDADREEINKAKALFYPKAQLGASRGRGETGRTTQTTNGTVESDLSYHTQNYALSVRQPLYNKETFATYQSAKSFVSSSEELLRQETAKLMLNLTGAYLEMLYAAEKVTLLKAKIHAVNRQLDQAEKRFKQGQGTVVEISEAETNLDIAKAELILANNALADHRESLFNMTGKTVEAPASLDVQKLPAKLEEHLDFWLNNAKQHNPEIAAATHTVEVARQEIEKRRAGHYPTVDLVGVRSYSENDSNNTLGSRFDSATVAVQMNVPLFAGGYVNASVRQAQDKLTAAEETLNSKLREARANVRKYFNNVHSQLLSILAYQQAVKSAGIALDGTQKGFTAGIKTNIEVLDAQQKLFSSQLELSKTQYGLINDWVNLKYSAGLLSEAELAKISQLFTGSREVEKHASNE